MKALCLLPVPGTSQPGKDDLVEESKIFTDLHPFTTATPGSAIIFMGRTVLLHPERMCPVFDQAILICWNLGRKHNNAIQLISRT
jgi:hypothetical protein